MDGVVNEMRIIMFCIKKMVEDYRWPLLYKWGQMKDELEGKEYFKLHGEFGELVRYCVLMEKTFGKNSYFCVYDWAEVHFWPLVTLDENRCVRYPNLSSLKPLLCDAIRQSYNLWRYEKSDVPVEDGEWENFVTLERSKNS
jgi:hypothetical protein